MLCATHRLPEHAPRETGALPRKVRKVVIPFTYIGTHALLMGRLAGPQGRVYAFEPQRKVYRELRRNIELNGLANVTALRYAVGAETRIVEMNPPREIGVVEASGNRLVGKALGEGGVAVGAGGDRAEMRPLDSFGFGSVSLLKIDVEGFEDEVLAGAERLISAPSRGER